MSKRQKKINFSSLEKANYLESETFYSYSDTKQCTLYIEDKSQIPGSQVKREGTTKSTIQIESSSRKDTKYLLLKKQGGYTTTLIVYFIAVESQAEF